MLRFIFLIDSGGGFLTGICFLGNGLFFLAWEFSPRTSSIWFLQKVQETKTYWTLTGVNYQSITAKSIHLLTVFRMWNKNTTASSTCFEQRTVLIVFSHSGVASMTCMWKIPLTCWPTLYLSILRFILRLLRFSSFV